VTAARQFDEAAGLAPPADGDATDALGGFLETTALVADTDAWDPGADTVSLMTLHAAKGLEFPVVHLVAMEDGILPHERSLDSPEHLEEERRLVFVGITRGREEVHASCARIRDYRGMRRISAPSLFLAEMQGSETIVVGSEAPPADAAFDPFGDAARRRGDEFDDLVHEDPDAAPARAEARVMRGDGLTMEREDSQAEPEPRGQSPRRRSPTAAIERASDLARRMAEAGAVPQRRYQRGQRVRHGEYGEGTLGGISGTGPRAVGTVIFDGPAGTRKFILGHGALEPLDDQPAP
jgi:DNA helicase-2/ATP-dependent DNA helicase PcrA